MHILIIGGLLLLGGGEGARLLRIPRIYNALITSDEELLPSQAYPAVSPVLRPATHIYLPAQASTYQEPEQPAEIPQYQIPSTEQEIISDIQIKNNRPSNPEIPDVPPPPIPVGKPKSRQGIPPIIPF